MFLALFTTLHLPRTIGIHSPFCSELTESKHLELWRRARVQQKMDPNRNNFSFPPSGHFCISLPNNMPNTPFVLFYLLTFANVQRTIKRTGASSSNVVQFGLTTYGRTALNCFKLDVICLTSSEVSLAFLKISGTSAAALLVICFMSTANLLNSF